MCWSLFVIKLPACKPTSLLKRDSNAVSSYENCEIFKNNFFYRTPPAAAF